MADDALTTAQRQVRELVVAALNSGRPGPSTPIGRAIMVVRGKNGPAVPVARDLRP
jgi:hypothetical protein